MTLLVKANADLNMADGDGWTPLFHATEEGHEAVVKILVEAGADLNKTVRLVTPLYMAAWHGDEAIVKILVKAGADLNMANNDGWTPLRITAEKGHEAVVKILLDANDHGWTPFLKHEKVV